MHIMLRISVAAFIATGMAVGCAQLLAVEDVSDRQAGMEASLPDAMPAPDQDEDGIPDTEDNCPGEANPGQTDEDGDAVGNACDNCPSVANPGQENAMDNDMVGDACDPNPVEDGDSIVFFDGFDEDSEDIPAGWLMASGPGNQAGKWSISGGALLQQEATDEPTTLYLSDLAAPADVLVETAGIMDRMPDDLSPAPHVGVIAHYYNAAANGGYDDGYLCTLARSKRTPDAHVKIAPIIGGDTSTAPVPDWSLSAAEPYRLVHVHSDKSSICEMIRPGGGSGGATKPVSSSTPNGERVGLQTRRVQASFDYILVYGLGTAR